MATGGFEVNLPDLPEVSIRLGPDGDALPLERDRRPRGRRWHGLRDTLSAYLPLLLMVVLALATWWLVKQAPPPPAPVVSSLPPGLPDYTLRGFTLERFAKDGRRELTLEGRELHHFPDNDRIQIEAVELLADLPDGGRTRATARQAVANGRASEVRLMGGAVVRGLTQDGQNVTVDSEFLLYRAAERRLTTDRPVTVVIGDSRTQAAGMSWDLASRALELKPPVRAVLRPRPGQKDTDGAR